MEPQSSTISIDSGRSIIPKNVIILICYSFLLMFLLMSMSKIGSDSSILIFSLLTIPLYFCYPVHIVLLISNARDEYRKNQYRRACLYIYAVLAMCTIGLGGIFVLNILISLLF